VSAKTCHMAKRRVGLEYSPSMLEPVRPGAASPDKALCLPTLSHFLIVNKNFSLSLSVSLSASLGGGVWQCGSLCGWHVVGRGRVVREAREGG
jgi:hypothetical protein